MSLFVNLLKRSLSNYAETRERENPLGFGQRPLFPERSDIPGSWGDKALDKERDGHAVGDFDFFKGNVKPDKGGGFW